MHCCHLADFIPTSVAFYTLLFDLGNQVINEQSNNLHLTLEYHLRFSLELLTARNLHLSQIPVKLQKHSQQQRDTTTIRTRVGGGGVQIRTETLRHRKGGEFFSSYHWSH